MADLGLTDRLKKQRDQSTRSLGVQYDNTDACYSFYNGDQMTYEDKIQFIDSTGRRKRATVNFNKVQSNVDSVVGFMAQNRRQAKFVPRLGANQEQQKYSKDMNALLSYHRENANADQVETDQDADMMICGYGATETDLSYLVGNSTTDPNGEIIKVRLDPKRVGWDPTATAKNLLGARWAYYFDDYDLKDALELFQGSKPTDFQEVDNVTADDRGYVWNPWGGLYDKIRYDDSVDWTAKEDNMVRVYNHQWYEYETFYKAKNPLYLTDSIDDALFYRIRLEAIASQIEPNGPENTPSEDMFEFDPTAEELVFNSKTKRLLVQDFGDLIDPVAFTRKVFHTCVYSGTHVFSKFRSISQQGFSIKFKTGIFNPGQRIWTGMVNSMMDPQKYYNKALTELMFTIAVNSKGGTYVERTAVEDIADFESKQARTDAVIVVEDGVLSGGRIQDKARPALPTGLNDIIMLSGQGISEAGVDPSFLGNLKEEQSGVLYKRRIRQVISKMARYFDSITLYQKEDARLYGDLIPVWIENNNGMVLRVTGEDGSDELTQITEDMFAPEYDVSIQEAPETPEDKQETADGIKQMGDAYLTIGDTNTAKAFHMEAIQLSPGIDGDVRNRLSKILQPAESVPMEAYQALQKELEQIKSALTQAEVAKIVSETEKNIATTEKTRMDVGKSQAETVKTFEDAKRIGMEADMIQSGQTKEANVNI